MKRISVLFALPALLVFLSFPVFAEVESGEVTVFGAPAPVNHGDMVNGFGSEWLEFANAGIFENYAEGLKFGLSVFGVILGVLVVSALLKKFIGFQMGADSSSHDRMEFGERQPSDKKYRS